MQNKPNYYGTECAPKLTQFCHPDEIDMLTKVNKFEDLSTVQVAYYELAMVIMIMQFYLSQF
jgi:hypothetical protein